MGLLGSILGSVVENIADGIKEASDEGYIEELLPKMINSALANDFEKWFESQLEIKPFLLSQYNFYDSCERLVIVDNDCVSVSFEIEKANISDEIVCNFATTLGYKPLSENGLTYSNGKIASERVLIKTFAQVIKDKMEKVLDIYSFNFRFSQIEFDDGTDKSASYSDRISQRLDAAAWGDSAKLDQVAGFVYYVAKQEQKSAF